MHHERNAYVGGAILKHSLRYLQKRWSSKILTLKCEVYDNLRGGGVLGDEAGVESHPDENVYIGLYPKGQVIHVHYSDNKQAKMV